MPLVPDKATQSKLVDRPIGGDSAMEWEKLPAEPHMTTMGRLYQPPSISGPQSPTYDIGHDIVDNSQPDVDDLIVWPVGDPGSADFNDGVLDDGWEFVSGTNDPTWDKFVLENNQLTWAYAAGEGADPGTGDTTAGQTAPRIERDMPVGDFVAHIMCATQPHQYNDGNYRGFGFCIYEEGGNSSRWEQYCQNSTTERGSKTYCVSGAGTIAFDDPDPPGTGSTGYATHFRLTRTGDNWALDVSYDGFVFQSVATATLAGFAPTKLGVYAYQIGDAGFPFQATIDHVHIGSQKLPVIVDEGNRGVIYEPAFRDTSEIDDNSIAPASISAKSGVLSMTMTTALSNSARFAAISSPIPADCGYTCRIVMSPGYTQGSAIFIAPQLRANAWRGVDWTKIYGPPLGWLAEINAGNNLHRALSIAGSEPISNDGGYWNFIVSGPGPEIGQVAIRMRGECIGPYYRQKSWIDGQAEPAAWDFTICDNTLRDAGNFGMAWGKNDNQTGSGTVNVNELEVYGIYTGSAPAQIGNGLVEIPINSYFETDVEGWLQQGVTTDITWNSAEQCMTVTTPEVTSGAFHRFTLEADQTADYLWLEGESKAASDEHTIRFCAGSIPNAGIETAPAMSAPGKFSMLSRADGGTEYNLYARHNQAQTVEWDNMKVFRVLIDLADPLEYDQQLRYFADRNAAPSTFNAGTSQYTSAGKVYRDQLTGAGWNITDGGQAT